MPVYCSVVFASHHLIVTWHSAVAFFLVFDEFLTKKLEQIRMRTWAFERGKRVGLVDTNNLFTTGFQAVFIELLHVDVFSLLVINMLCLTETLFLESNAFFLKCFHLSDHPVDFYPLHSVELSHVNIWVLTFNNLSRRDLTTCVARLCLYIQHLVDFALYNFIDLFLLALILFF